MAGSDPIERRPKKVWKRPGPAGLPAADTCEHVAAAGARVRDASSVFLLGVALAATFHLAYQALRTVVALPRPRPVAWPWRRTAPVPAPLPLPAAGPVPLPAAEPIAPAFVETRRIYTGGFAAWHYPPFAIYFVGLLAGVTGYFMYITSASWLALELTNSAAGVSFLFTVSSLPMLFLTLFGGAIADRFNRKWIVVVTRLLIAGTTALLGLFALTGALTVPIYIVLALTLGVIWSLDLPTRQALVADLVPTPVIGNAYAWQSVLQFVGSTAGPVVAGAIVVGAGPGVALIIGASGHVLVSSCLLLVKTTRRPSTSRESIPRRVWTGLTYIFHNRPVLLLMLLATVPAVTAWGVQPLLPIVARDVLHGNAGTLGWLTGSMGVGSILGAIFVALTGRIGVKGVLSITGTGLTGAALIGVAYADHLGVALAFLLAMGAVSGVAATLTALLVQVLTPEEYQGRVASVYMMTWNVQPIGVLAFGSIAQTQGVPFAFWAAGWCSIVLTLLLALAGPPLRRLRA